MKRKILAITILLALLLAAAGVSIAQATPGSLIGWFALAGGSGSASGGNVTLQGTVGLPIVGPAAGGPVSLGAGYWYGVDASSPNFTKVYLPLLRRP